MNKIIEKYKEMVGKSKNIAIIIPYLLLSIGDLILFENFHPDENLALYLIILKNSGNVIFAYFLGNYQHKKYKEYLRVNGILQGSGN